MAIFNSYVKLPEGIDQNGSFFQQAMFDESVG